MEDVHYAMSSVLLEMNSSNAKNEQVSKFKAPFDFEAQEDFLAILPLPFLLTGAALRLKLQTQRS